MKQIVIFIAFLVLILNACTKEETELQELNNQTSRQSAQNDSTYTPEEMAELLSAMQLSHIVVHEIHDAITEYTVDGYDEYVCFKDIIAYEPVGDDPRPLPVASSGDESNRPQCPLFTEALVDYLQYTTYGVHTSVDEIIEMLKESDLELYWPYSELWDGNTMPSYAYVNSWSYDGDVLDGYDADGMQVSIDENYAKDSPVFVVRPKSKPSGHENDGISEEEEDQSDWEEGDNSDDDGGHNPVDGNGGGGGGSGWIDPDDGDPNNSVTYSPMYYKYKLLLTDIKVLRALSSYPWWQGGMEVTFYNFAPKQSLAIGGMDKSEVICKYTFDFTKSQIARKASYRLTDAARNDTLTLGLNSDWDLFQINNRFVCMYNYPEKVSYRETFMQDMSTTLRTIVNGEDVLRMAFGSMSIKEKDKILENRLLTFSQWNDVNKRHLIIADGMFEVRVEIIQTSR